MSARGFTVSPILLVAIFLMAITFSFYLSSADEKMSVGIGSQGTLQRLWNEQLEARVAMKTIVLRELGTNTTVNNRDLMSQAIEQELSKFNADVEIIGGEHDITRIQVDVNHNLSDGNVTVNFTGFVDNFTHPFYLFNKTASAYNPANPNVCNHVDGVACTFAEAAYEGVLSTPELKWNIIRKGLVCNPAVVLKYEVELTYNNNLLSEKYAFQLKDKATGLEEFSVNC